MLIEHKPHNNSSICVHSVETLKFRAVNSIPGVFPAIAKSRNSNRQLSNHCSRRLGVISSKSLGLDVECHRRVATNFYRMPFESSMAYHLRV
jgi:hypothetical protein